MSSSLSKESLSAWAEHWFHESDDLVSIKEADVCKETERVVFSLFQLDRVQVGEVVLFVSLSQLSMERARRKVYNIGVIVKGSRLTQLQGDGGITLRNGLKDSLKDFQYIRHESGHVISGDTAPVGALFDDDRSVMSVEQYVRSSVDGRVCSRPIVTCSLFHGPMKSEMESDRGNASGRKRRLQEDEDQAPKRRRVEVRVSCSWQYEWKC